MDFFDDLIDATPFKTAQYEYEINFKELLSRIYTCHEYMQEHESKLPKNENKIRDILVDKYLSPNISDYTFKKEKLNNLGRVDIYIIDKLDNSKPHFIIECKLLDNKNNNGVNGLNAEYIKNGIQRLLTEHYYIENNYYVNAMIGFIITDLDINNNIISLNLLVNKLLNNLVKVTLPITLDEKNIYKSSYKTLKNKEFIIYHLMMDFSDNI